MRALLLILAAALAAAAADYRAPAGIRPAARRPGAESILPGGRIIAPIGRHFTTGGGPWGLAISPSGKAVASADGGPGVYSVTIIKRDSKDNWLAEQHRALRKADKDDKVEDEDDWRSVFMGIAFEGEKTLFASEGNSGKVRLLNADTGRRIHSFDLNSLGTHDAYTGDLVFDKARNLLHVIDQANYRIVTFDVKKRRPVSSARTGRLPFAIALSPDGNRVYVTNIGMFDYKAVPGIDPRNLRDTGLIFPATGFPSEEAEKGVRRETMAGPVEVPGLGDPNVKDANSIAVINVADPAAPKLEGLIPTGRPFGKESLGGSSPSGVIASDTRIYAANGHNDSITVINAKTLTVEREIEIRIPGLEKYRGVLPTGLDIAGNWLLVAESGINAIGVIDIRTNQVLGHIPTAWFPTRVAHRDGNVFVTCARGHGTGPNATREAALADSFQANIRHGEIAVFPMPSAGALQKHTDAVMAANGFVPAAAPPTPIPAEIKYVVLIVKENRTFDEVLGDIQQSSNGAVNGAWDLARYGRYGIVRADRKELRTRFSLKSVNATPNHHAIAERFAFSDNFYADSEVSVDGHHWLVGTYPNAWTESSRMAGGGAKKFLYAAPGRLHFMESNSSVTPENQLEAGAIWHHFDRNGVSFRNYGEGFELPGVDESPGIKPTGARYLTNVPMPEPLFRNTARDYPGYNMNIPDQYRATQFINDIENRFVKPGVALPRFLYIHLPNDHTAKPRPEDGYPFAASYVADNDYALGRIVEYLSKTEYWKNMAVFVTEDDAQGGVDHVDSHRTVLLAAGPYVKRDYVSHTHSSFPGLLKTIFRIFGLPPLNLYDAVASDLADMFAANPDFTPYKVMPINHELFNPDQARDPLDPLPQPKMDDPAELNRQHKQK